MINNHQSLFHVKLYEVMRDEKIVASCRSMDQANAYLKEATEYYLEYVLTYPSCCSEKWCPGDKTYTWHIRERHVLARVTNGYWVGNAALGELLHVFWQCPYCQKWYTVDVDSNETSPLFASCSRRSHDDLYFLVEFDSSIDWAKR